jgi:polyhydroxyalkanoate synthesis repressor PhaR
MTPRPATGAPSTKQTIIKSTPTGGSIIRAPAITYPGRALRKWREGGEDFVVQDTTTGEDITHSVLSQIIVAQETVQTEPLLPSEFMRRLLTFYGDTLRSLLGCYLDFLLLTISNESMRSRMAETGSSALNLVDEQVQQNIRFFESILLNFGPSRPAANPNEPTENGQTNHAQGYNRR